MTAKPKRNWAAWSGWAAVVLTIIGGLILYGTERGQIRTEVGTLKDARAIRNTYVDSKLEAFDVRLRDQGKSLARIEAQAEQAQRERQEIKEIMRRIWGAVRRGRN